MRVHRFSEYDDTRHEKSARVPLSGSIAILVVVGLVLVLL